MKKTIKSHRSLMGLIYALFMLFPLLSFANRFLYTVFNENAFESYYGETINEKQITPTSTIENNKDYLLINASYTTDIQQVFTYDLIEILEFGGSDTQLQQLQLCNKCYLRTNGYNYVFYQNNSYITEINTTNTSLQMLITLTSYSDTNVMLQILKNISYNKYSYLDNNFEYSMYLFTENHGTGVLDLTSWFTNQFISADDTHALLYINFINWYMNYTLLVSCVYLLYAVLMWFLTWARRILSKGLDEGGIY